MCSELAREVSPRRTAALRVGMEGRRQAGSQVLGSANSAVLPAVLGMTKSNGGKRCHP
jgi:hypothetical protein